MTGSNSSFALQTFDFINNLRTSLLQSITSYVNERGENDQSLFLLAKSHLQVVKDTFLRRYPRLDHKRGAQRLGPGIASVAKELEKPDPELSITGGKVRFRLDKISVLRNILVHLIRNFLDHGIESPPERLSARKPKHGIITLSVSTLDDMVVVTYADDGRCLSHAALEEKSRANGFITGPDATDAQVAAMIFMSGISTATKVTEISGRGVGMDTVKDMMNEVSGSIDINFTGSRSKDSFRPFELAMRFPRRRFIIE